MAEAASDLEGEPRLRSAVACNVTCHKSETVLVALQWSVIKTEPGQPGSWIGSLDHDAIATLALTTVAMQSDA